MAEPQGAAGPPTQSFRSDVDRIRGARAYVRDAISKLGLHPVDDLDLLTSEIVSNAVEHAVTDQILVRVRRAPQGARVEVHDDDPTPPHLRPATPTVPGGLGLRLVAALSSEWGVEEIVNDGKIVWFQIELPGQGSPR